MIKNIIQIVLLLPLLIAAVIDQREKIIPDKLNAVIAFIGVISIITDKQNYKEYLLTAGTIFVVFLILGVISDGKIGGGDIKLFTVLSLTYGYEIINIILISHVLALIALIPKLLNKKITVKESIPLAPYIFMAAVFYFIINK